MRFDTKVYMRAVKAGVYDSDTGDYGSDSVVETPLWADVTTAGEQAMTLVYGTIKQDAMVVRLQSHYDTPFDSIRIGEKVYKVDFSRRLPVRHVFTVSEVQ